MAEEQKKDLRGWIRTGSGNFYKYQEGNMSLEQFIHVIIDDIEKWLGKMPIYMYTTN